MDSEDGDEWIDIDDGLRVRNVSAIRRYAREIYGLLDSRCQVTLDIMISYPHDDTLVDDFMRDVIGSQLAQGRIAWRFQGQWEPSGPNPRPSHRDLLARIATITRCMPHSGVAIRRGDMEIDLTALSLFSDINTQSPARMASLHIVKLDLEEVDVPSTGSLPLSFPDLKQLLLIAASLRALQDIVAPNLARLELLRISDPGEEMPLLLEHVLEAYPRLQRLAMKINARQAVHAGDIIAACRLRGRELSLDLTQIGVMSS